MAKHAVVALVFACMLVAGMAADTGRGLQQAVKYDCNGAKQINSVKGACNLLCTCAGSLNALYNSPNMKAMCTSICNNCAAAAQKCAPGSPLPRECSAGTSIKEVNTCITTFLRARSG
ncbi:hypothetical protein HT031_005385 [Scenedesmus sp. PABB004]|nr:hypothetical protein HT031_005385 [Scenedesmus sp. PABB004]